MSKRPSRNRFASPSTQKKLPRGTIKKDSSSISSSRVSIRKTISSLVKILHLIGIRGVSAEIIRSAKFDDTKAVKALWRMLHDLVIIGELREKRLHAGEMKDPEDLYDLSISHEHLDTLYNSQPNHTASCEFVHSRLEKWGFLPSSLLLEIHEKKNNDENIISKENLKVRPTNSSRILLLGTAWLIEYLSIIQSAGWHLLKQKRDIELLPPFPREFMNTAMSRKRQFEKQKALIFQQQKWLNLKESKLQETNLMRCNQVLIIYGRIRAAIVKICALARRRARIASRLNELQKKTSSRSSERKTTKEKQDKPLLPSAIEILSSREPHILYLRENKMRAWIEEVEPIMHLLGLGGRRPVHRANRHKKENASIWEMWINTVIELECKRLGDREYMRMFQCSRCPQETRIDHHTVLNAENVVQEEKPDIFTNCLKKVQRLVDLIRLPIGEDSRDHLDLVVSESTKALKCLRLRTQSLIVRLGYPRKDLPLIV